MATGVTLSNLAEILMNVLNPLVELYYWAAGIAFGVLGGVSGICFGTSYRDIVANIYIPFSSAVVLP